MKLNNDTIINFLAVFLPFTNEISNVLTSSGLPFFKNLYKQCIDPFIIDEELLKFINVDKICKQKHIISKLVIDLIALIGIIIYIGKNSIKYDLLTGILSGSMMVLFSFIIPNLFLHKTIHFIMKTFNLSGPFYSIAIGFFCIGILLISTILLEKIIIRLTKGVKIDSKIEINEIN